MAWIYHMVFTDSSGGGHLGCSHCLTIVDSTAMNIHFRFCLNNCSMFNLLMRHRIFSTASVPFYIPTSNVLRVLNSSYFC